LCGEALYSVTAAGKQPRRKPQEGTPTMTKFAPRLAISAALSLAGAVLAATPALAGQVQLRTNDIDLASPSGKAELAKRIHAAANEYCKYQRDTGSLTTSTVCVNGVEQELAEKVAQRTTSTRMAANH